MARPPGTPYDAPMPEARTHYNLGLALQQKGDHAAAIAAYRQAIALDPGLAEAHDRMGDLLRQRGKNVDAAAAYERAARAAPDTTLGRLSSAKALIVMGRAEAEERLREVIAVDGTSSEAHFLLGYLLSAAGRFDEAAASYERAVALEPRSAKAYQGLVRSRRLTEAERPWVARMEALLKDPAVPPRDRMTLHFAAGKAQDDLGDYAAAIQHFDAANVLRRKVASPFDRRELGKVTDRLIALFTPDFFARHAAVAQDDETPVLLVGMPRSGTTLFERILSSHAKVAGGGELGFWNRRGAAWLREGAADLGTKAGGLADEYIALLRKIGPDALRVTDKMPANRFWVGLVHAVLPKARFVHCRRNPIDTCLSIYSTHFSEHWGFACDRGDLAASYREHVRLMAHWRAVIPGNRLLEVDYEDVTSKPEETARRLVAFAGLEWDPACLRPEENRGEVKTANKWQARQPIYRTSVERWRNYEPWLGELRGLLP
jgi:tetratricopeptide (TPR) repeat protein